MKKHLLLSGVVGLTMLASCGKDDDVRVPDVIEGTWNLDSFQFTDMPVGFASYEGFVLSIQQITSWEDYEIVFAADNTFSRRIYVAGPDITDEGTWEKDGEDLILVSDEDPTFDEEYVIERNDDIELIWSETVSFGLLPDNVADTLTDAYFNSLTEEEQDALYVRATFSLNSVFNKTN